MTHHPLTIEIRPEARSVTLALAGELDDTQRQRLMEIADRCPVHKTLSGEIRIETHAAGK